MKTVEVQVMTEEQRIKGKALYKAALGAGFEKKRALATANAATQLLMERGQSLVTEESLNYLKHLTETHYEFLLNAPKSVLKQLYKTWEE